jgi:3'-phosphoadenosine 5'-phosphosulfate sulfotransferase (PAPS reductase)/FAD synthetase
MIEKILHTEQTETHDSTFIGVEPRVKLPPKRFISFSGGVESSTQCLIYGSVAKPIFADTGAEHEEMYERLDYFEKRMKEFHGSQFEIIRVSAGSLKDYIKKTKFFPAPTQRYCTRMFKIKPIDDFLMAQGECELMIGLNANEASDRVGNLEMVENVKYTYPLIENGLTREHCKALLRKANVEPAFPPYMQRGGCDICFYKSKKEWRSLVLLNEQKALELAEFEESIQDRRDKYYYMNSAIGRMRNFIQSVKDQGELFDMSQTYPTYDDIHSPCGVFCHR